MSPGNNQQSWRYETLISDILTQISPDESKPNNSALGNLLALIMKNWLKIHPNGTEDEFNNWLEVTMPLTIQPNDIAESELIECIDTLDSLLLSSIEELEKIHSRELSLPELEYELKKIWGRSYAAFSTQDESQLKGYFIERGKALKETIYPARNERIKLYYSGLPPRKGVKLLSLYEQIIQHLQNGISYAAWDNSIRVAFLTELICFFDEVDIFKLPPTGCGQITWKDLLKWWLCPLESGLSLTPKQLMKAHEYISKNFIYQINWWFGNITAYTMNVAGVVSEEPFRIQEWPKTGLPWSTFWIKELITWGTLDPVASYLMATRSIKLRALALEQANTYYIEKDALANSDELYNPVTIREWATRIEMIELPELQDRPKMNYYANLLRDFSGAADINYQVRPYYANQNTFWFDAAGYKLAVTNNMDETNPLTNMDFELIPSEATVNKKFY